MAKRPVPPIQHIPDEDTVARFCDANTTFDAAGNVTGAAFLPRPVDDGRVSVEWVECVMAALPEMTRDNAIRDRLSKRVSAYSATGKIALLNVGAIRRIRQDPHNLDVLRAPTRSSQCHAVITGVSDLLALTLAERLADLANANAIRA